jgi:hypothetical protein
LVINKQRSRIDEDHIYTQVKELEGSNISRSEKRSYTTSVQAVRRVMHNQSSRPEKSTHKPQEKECEGSYITRSQEVNRIIHNQSSGSEKGSRSSSTLYST